MLEESRSGNGAKAPLPRGPQRRVTSGWPTVNSYVSSGAAHPSHPPVAEKGTGLLCGPVWGLKRLETLPGGVSGTNPDGADLPGVMSLEYPASGVLAGGARDDLENRPSWRKMALGAGSERR